MIRRTLITLAAIASLTTAQACGPDFFPDVFVRTTRPDLPQQYVQGHLGILQKDFPSADLFVAYRYLSGGTLTPAEQKGWSPTYSVAEQDAMYAVTTVSSGPANNVAPSGVAVWMTERSKYPGSPTTSPDPDRQQKIAQNGYSYTATFPNCAQDAFRTAAATLTARATAWGAKSPALRDWISAQDAVFNACSSSVPLPQPAPQGSPLLLQQDRAYQVAAARFYGQNFDAATHDFQAIAADKASPWHDAAGYLAGRVLIRKAFLSKQGADAPADYDPAAMQAAAAQLRTVLGTNPQQPWRHAAQAMLNLVRIRLEPAARTQELSALLAGPAPDADYKQDVQDMLWILRTQIPDGFRASPDNYTLTKDKDGADRLSSPSEALTSANAVRDQAFAETATLRSRSALLDWTITIRSLAPASATHALAMWKQTHTTPWLVAALMLVPDTASPDAALLQAAADVPATAPAYQTIALHRARLQLAAGDLPAARSTLSALQSAVGNEPAALQEPSTINATRTLLMQASSTRQDFLARLARTVLETNSQPFYASRDCSEAMKGKSDSHHCLTPGKDDLDTAAARTLNEQAPLTLWTEAANSSSIPQPLRQAIAMQGWTRATLLNNPAAAAALQSLLPDPLQTQLRNPSPLTPWMTLARNPGLQPHLDPGTQRAYSYDFVENYRDNWCYNPAQYPQPNPTAAAITAQDRAQGQADAKALSTLRSVDVGRKIVTAVNANPQDPQAPEALFLVLRMIRYGCNPVHEPSDQQTLVTPDTATGDQLLKLRRDTAALMRRYYATNSWTKKAAPFVGEVHPPKA